ncbi:MAG: hypothetical protein AAFR96_02595 [Planctomycetota bacterium]
MTHQSAPSRRGFSLTDVLAATAAVGIAAAIAQPAITSFRSTSFAMTNMNQHRLLAAQQGLFIAANDGQFTGPTTSGWPGQNGLPIDGDRFVGNTTSTTPVQQQDWITPLVGDMFGFSPNRALRTKQLFDTIRDPALQRQNDTLFVNNAAEDLSDFVNVLKNGGGFHAVSYLSPAAFQFWGTPNPGTGFMPGVPVEPSETEEWFKQFGGSPNNYGGAFASTIKTPSGYRPRIDQVGTSPAEKVQFADGTRYLQGNLLDIEVNPASNGFGNHTSGFLPWEGETSYGRSFNFSPNQENVRLSVRRPGIRSDAIEDRVLYVSFFDGSTRPVSLSTAKSRPDWWAPTGSEWVSVGAIAPELEGLVQPGDLLP